MAKVIFIVMDGLGDRPVREFGEKTPLEKANTPNFDRFAANGVCGLMYTLGRGRTPGSDIAHLAIFGYDPAKYYTGRGPIEVRGLGIPLLTGDVALRGNFGTVDRCGIIIDRRAGRVRDVSEFASALDGTIIDGVTFVVKPGTAHRAGVVMRGPGLSARISDADPHVGGVAVRPPEPLDASAEARHTAKALSEFLERAHSVLSGLPINQNREQQGLPPANYLLVRGAGYYSNVPSIYERCGLRAACIAGGGLYKGIGAYLGMDLIVVPGATALPDTDVLAKFRAAVLALETHDFVFVHVKAADSLGEDGNFQGKSDFIERVDEAASVLAGLDDVLILVTGDHSTPCVLRKHSSDPVPVLVHGPGVRVDAVTSFGERACALGGLGHFSGLELMPQVLNLLGTSHLEGA
jgi:2,3-bisphosphoglycerate-independent phosphoglycerate mutase